MTTRTASSTALATARLRAAHQILDAAPHILDDTVAQLLLGPDSAREIEERYFKSRPRDIPVPVQTGLVAALRE